MDFKEFANRMEQDVRNALKNAAHGATVRRSHISKPQGQSYDALLVKPAGGGVGISLNLTGAYEKLLEGDSYDGLYNDFVHAVTEYLEHGGPNIDVLQCTDYEQAKRLLYVEVIGTARNAETLAGIPHTDVEDLSLVYRIRLGGDKTREMSALVTNSMLGIHGISKEQLHVDAMESSRRNRPAQIMTMRAITAELIGVPEESLPDDGIPPMYVLTNTGRFKGAAALFYPGIMKMASNALGGSFFILPSSVHEVLLLPDDGEVIADDLRRMVSSINATEVSPEEQLTDNVYHYDASSGTFETGEKYEARKFGA